MLLEDGCEAYPELVEDVVWAPSLNESQMFTFVTIASSNSGLNLKTVCHESQYHIHQIYNIFGEKVNICAPSLNESQMFNFVTIASSNKGLNLQQCCYEP